jgi:tetratricopeptide (TPR) repeat protein
VQVPTADQANSQGLELYRAGRFEDAIAAFAQAQQAFLVQDNLKGAAECANNRGVAARQAARLDEAEAAFTEAYHMSEKLGDRLSQGMVAGNLGALAESRDQRDRAVAFYKQAIELFEAAGAAELAAETWRALSRLRMKQGEWFAALGAYDASLDSVRHPTPTQRALRSLLGVSRRLMRK